MTIEPVIELYSVRDAARLFGVTESRLRYWIQTGFVRPSVRQAGRFYYTFADLVAIKTAIELLGAGLTQPRVRAALEALRGALPPQLAPTSRLRVCSDGDALEVLDDQAAWERDSSQLVMAFAVSSLGAQIASRLEASAGTAAAASEGGDDDDAAAVPHEIDPGGPGWGVTEPTAAPSAYQDFLEGCRAEDAGDLARAEACYRHALELEPSLAAVHTNVGNLRYRRGDLEGARRAYERALELEPDQPEARFNLANLLDETGDTEMAVAELRTVCSRHPTFADAHYNLGLLLHRLGGVAQARHHLGCYLDLDDRSSWAGHARELLAAT